MRPQNSYPWVAEVLSRFGHELNRISFPRERPDERLSQPALEINLLVLLRVPFYEIRFEPSTCERQPYEMHGEVRRDRGSSNPQQ